MAFDPNLNVVITGAQQDAIKADLLDSKNALNAIATVTLSNEERSHLNGINDLRLPKVQRAVTEFANDYPGLVGPKVTAARAQNLFLALVFLRELKANLTEYQDRIDDLSNNIEEILYNRFTTDMYYLAKRYRGDVEGADVVADYLGELFEGQGDSSGDSDTLTT